MNGILQSWVASHYAVKLKALCKHNWKDGAHGEGGVRAYNESGWCVQ